MSIVTRTGDSGSTGLMYNRRVSKSDPRVAAYGCVDELNAALGLARAFASNGEVRGQVLAIQKDLVVVMGELATQPDDLARYVADGFQQVSKEMVQKLDRMAAELEGRGMVFKGWVMPGKTPAGAGLDLARTTCRRAERHACSLQAGGQLGNPEIIVFLNRLADVLWLMARWEEREPEATQETAKAD